MRSRRNVLAFGLALAYSLALLGDNMMYVFLPSHPGAARIAAASLGVVLSANRFVRLATNSLGGLLSDRLGRRRPYLLGMMLALASILRMTLLVTEDDGSRRSFVRRGAQTR